LGLGVALTDEVTEVDVSRAAGTEVEDVGVMIVGKRGNRDGVFGYIQPYVE
jgi:hypothetical protein